MPPGVDDKVGTVETTIVPEVTKVVDDTEYGDTKAVPGFDEETGCGVDSPDAIVPGRDPVHMTDGGLPGESEHESPNVV